MPKTIKVKRGSDYLADYKIEDLKRILWLLPDGKPRMMVHAAILRKEGNTCEDIEKILKKGKSTIHDWLVRLDEGGLCRIYDRFGTGRPCKISDDEKLRLELFICNGPRACGYERDNWTSGLLRRHVQECFGVSYTTSGILHLAKRMDYTVRGTRPVPYNSASPEEQADFRDTTYEEQMEYRKMGYTILTFDASGKTDSPSVNRGIRRRGGTDTISTNYSKKSIQMLGMLGDDTLHMMFSHTYNSDDTIRMLDHVLKIYKKIYCVMDNAGANKSAKIVKHVAESDGNIVLRYILPHTPQLSSIEPQWSAIKRGIGGTYYGSFESMQQSIKNALESGEIPVVRPQKYMLEPDFERGDARVEVICVA